MRIAWRRILLGVLLLAGPWAVGGCGEPGSSGPPEPPEVNRTTWQSVFHGVLGALERQDLAGLRALLTPFGRQQLEHDLRAFSTMLANPEQGPRIMQAVRRRWPEVPAALVEGARAGSSVDAWTLYMRSAAPQGVAPTQAGLKIDPTRPDDAEVLYRYGQGPEQPVRLQRVKGIWAVDHVGLPSL